MDQQQTLEIQGMDVEEGFELTRVTSLDTLNTLSRSPSTPSTLSSPSSRDNDIFRVTALDHLNPTSPTLGTSLDNLTVRIEDENEGKRRSPEKCGYMGMHGELACFKKAVNIMFQMHFYSLLCLIVCGAYIAIYVPLVITEELKFKISHTVYRNVPQHTRLALALGYSLQNAYVGLFGFILMTLVIGFKRFLFAIPFNVFMFCGITGFIFAYYIDEAYYRTIHPFYSIIVYILIGIQILGTAGGFGYKVGHFRAVIGFTAVVTIALLVFVGIIDYVGVPVFMSASNIGKSVFRISVIPCILVIKVVVIRVICRFSDFSNLYMNTDGGGTLSFTIALIPVFVRAFYGRIFYLNVPTLSNLAWNAILVEVFDITFKLAHWNRRYALNVFTPLVRKYYFLKPLLDKPSGDSFYSLCLCFEKTVDTLAIGYATLIQILYQYKWEDDPDYSSTVYAMLIQYVVEAVAQLISFRLEHGFGIPSLTITKKIKFWTIYPILVSTSLMIAMTCTWRGVFIVHGTYWIR